MGLTLNTSGASELAAKLRDQARRAKAPTPALRVAATELESIVMDSFGNSSSPSGQPWPPLAPSTLLKRALSRGGKRRKLRKGSRGFNVGVDLGLNNKAARNISNVKPLLDTGRGRNATSVKADGTRLIFRNNVAYMRAHLGGDTKRSPQRPPMRQWAPFVWVGGRWVFDPRGRGGQWLQTTKDRVLRYIVRGEP